MRMLFCVLGSALAFACGTPEASRNQHQPLPPSSTSKEYAAIYDAVAVVIKDVRMNKKFGIRPVPADSAFRLDDSELLTRMIVPPSGNPIERVFEDDSIYFEIGLRRCLSKADVEHMLRQKAAHKNFRWDNTRLGFAESNTTEWYEISVPLFSRDSTKAVVGVHYRCLSMECNGDTPVVLTKVDGAWTSEAGPVVLN